MADELNVIEYLKQMERGFSRRLDDFIQNNNDGHAQIIGKLDEVNGSVRSNTIRITRNEVQLESHKEQHGLTRSQKVGTGIGGSILIILSVIQVLSALGIM
jgi:hypothetical protein